MTKKNKKFLLKTTIAFSCFAAFFLFFSAQAQENKSKESVSCNQEIPIGEIMEETTGFMGKVRSDAIGLQSLLKQEIAASEQLISSVQSCDVKKCVPSCDIKSYSLPDGQGGAKTFSSCEANECKGEICPENKINSDFARIKSIYEEIEASQKEAKNSIEKKDFSFSLKPYYNPLFPLPLLILPDIKNKTRSETIQAKLDASRGFFDACFSTPQEWQEVMEGSKIGKTLLSCIESLDFVKDDLSEDCKDSCLKDPKGDKCTECLGCKSPGNYFCCTTK